jgi:uncharacterized GH25 family protein
VAYEQPGTYVLSVETNPGYYTAWVDKNGRQRHSIKPKSAVASKAKEIKLSLYAKQFSKTYVVCKEPSQKFPARVGLKLELAPMADITRLKSGETLELKVYYKGKPYEGEGVWDATYNGFSTESEDYYYPKTPVKGSTLKVFIPRPGRWFLRYFIKIPAQGKDLVNYTQEKITATLVFQICNPLKRAGSKGH